MKNNVRNFSTILLALVTTALFAAPALAAKSTVRTMPHCSCCDAYVKYLRKEGFDVSAKPAKDMDKLGDRLGVPKDIDGLRKDNPMWICHLMKIGGYVVVGHVPAKVIRRLLREKPQGVEGIILPGMPAGSPGMKNMSGKKKGPFVVYAFDGHGKSWVYAKI